MSNDSELNVPNLETVSTITNSESDISIEYDNSKNQSNAKREVRKAEQVDNSNFIELFYCHFNWKWRTGVFAAVLSSLAIFGYIKFLNRQKRYF